MSSATEKAAARVNVDQSHASGTVRRMSVPTIILCGAALISLALVVAAGVARFRTPRNVPVHWGVLQPIDRSVAARGPASDPEDTNGALLVAESDTLASLGSKLDAAGFGKLGSTRRLDLEATIPISRRWQISFSPGLTEGQYAGHLAALGIELGVLAADGSLQYVTGIGSTGAKRRAGAGKGDRRPYWTWGRGDLKRADQVLLRNAGLPVSDEIVLHFLSPETIEELEKLEKEFQNRKPQDILLTRFALKRTFRGYEVFVAEQIER